MTKERFIELYTEKAKNFLRAEACDLGEGEVADEYVEDNLGCIFVGTEEEVNEETNNGEYFIIAKNDGWLMVETFGGTSYAGTEYGIK